MKQQHNTPKEQISAQMRKHLQRSQIHAAIRKYLDDPGCCATGDVDHNVTTTVYVSDDGERTSISAQFMREDFVRAQLLIGQCSSDRTVESMLEDFTQEEVFVPDMVGAMDGADWDRLEGVHFSIAFTGIDTEDCAYLLDKFGILVQYDEITNQVVTTLV